MAQHAEISAIRDCYDADQTVMTVAFERRFRDLLTILMGNLELLQRQLLNNEGQRQLDAAIYASAQLGDFLPKKEP